MKKLLNIDETVFDIIFCLFSVFIVGNFIPKNSALIDMLNPFTVFILIILIEFFIMIYMGNLYDNLMEYSWKTTALNVLMKISFFIAVTGLYVILLITILFFDMYRGDETFFYLKTNQEISMVILVILAYPLILGYIIGFPAEDWGDVKYILYIPAVMYVVMYPLSVIIFFYYSQPVWAVVILLAGSGGLILPAWLKKFLQKREYDRIRKKAASNKEFLALYTEERRKTNPVLFLFKKLLLPAVIMIMFIFWEDLTLITMVQAAHNNHAPVTQSLIIWSLLLSGIVPLRILAFFTPPVKILNLLTGAVSMVFYYLSLTQYLPVLAGITMK